MSYRTPQQLRTRRRVERALELAAPALDVLLFAGDRISRVAARAEISGGDARRTRLSSPDVGPHRAAARSGGPRS